VEAALAALREQLAHVSVDAHDCSCVRRRPQCDYLKREKRCRENVTISAIGSLHLLYGKAAKCVTGQSIRRESSRSD